MSIEKPYSTIRKAIEGTAEQEANNEFLAQPEPRHYKDALQFYKYLRGFEPDRIEMIINLAAKGKELKDETGPERLKIFKKVLDEVMEGTDEKLKNALDQIKKTKDLSQEQLSQENIGLHKRYFQIKTDELRNDPRLLEAFSGKEDLLNRNVDYVKATELGLVESYEKRPAGLQTLTWEEAIAKMQKAKRGNLSKGELKKKAELEAKLGKEESGEESLFDKVVKLIRRIH